MAGSTWSDILQLIAQQRQKGDPNAFDTVRRHYLNQLHQLTERDTILYSTAWTQNQGGSPGLSITNEDVHGFMEAVHGLEGPELDLILHSPGGSAEATEQIVAYLRAKFSEIRIFVPQSAMSAATLMCCAADEVVMGNHSSLGPIDPQIGIQTQTGVRTTAAQAILDQFEMAKSEISTNTDLLAWLPILRQYAPGLVAECEEAKELSIDLAEEWATQYMHGGDPDAEQKARQLAEYLANRREFKSHSRRISREQAAENGFNVTALEDDQDLQDLVLAVFHATSHTHNGTPLVKLIENHTGRAFMKSLGSDAPEQEEKPAPEKEEE
ncbi:SDH family Clp fold serine proteinase [Halomarina ordinaria]|uniref:Serine protease n=1 Tax=Halomarina ordinaria TaxID=3033939 RepID=A0ABD5U8T9_9EURY|nr:hypothetical protein [Halomarina sp. PSRA2]